MSVLTARQVNATQVKNLSGTITCGNALSMPGTGQILGEGTTTPVSNLTRGPAGNGWPATSLLDLPPAQDWGTNEVLEGHRLRLEETNGRGIVYEVNHVQARRDDQVVVDPGAAKSNRPHAFQRWKCVGALAICAALLLAPKRRSARLADG